MFQGINFLFIFAVISVEYFLLVTTTVYTPTPASITTTYIPPTTSSVCPHAPRTAVPNFKNASEVQFWETVTDDAPLWSKSSDGLIVKQASNCAPSALIAPYEFEGVDLKGSFQPDVEDDDLFGIIFSYVSNTRFYLLSWKSQDQDWYNLGTAFAGLTIQAVSSTDGRQGRSDLLTQALWLRTNEAGQAITLFRDPLIWKAGTNYTWLISHRPRIGYIRLKMFDSDFKEILDSGSIFDSSFSGGRFGAYAYSQKVVFDNFRYRCTDSVSEAVYLTLGKTQRENTHVEFFNEKEFLTKT